ncbi:coordinator of PRMT5 and differentiation stimulator isoform X2 [Falco cherrug]|uniref:coordinator of PRMT5 and differentiation stimulator isoform X2 n=1 Tax=Falco cherrug TaxID=345164 RepID=UPI0024783923|nr:coordinator of PRMT5 and differentiation stimulator isoform X2 [Falco cherrug]XP_055582598.1 coordinator of PRMT5 and differentiation stimulator isoform X2 [Falco cherrug]
MGAISTGGGEVMRRGPRGLRGAGGHRGRSGRSRRLPRPSFPHRGCRGTAITPPGPGSSAPPEPARLTVPAGAGAAAAASGRAAPPAREGGRGRRTSPHGGASPGPAAARPQPPSRLAGMARLLAPPPRQVMAAVIESASFDEEQLSNKRETMTWKPRKECPLKNIPSVLDSESEESEFSDTSHNENVSGSPVDCAHIHPDLEDLDGEVSGMPEAVTFPELQTATVYEVEDWDKELEESESNPYDSWANWRTAYLWLSLCL